MPDTVNSRVIDSMDNKGPTEKLRDQEKSAAEQLVPGTEVPGAQDPDSEEIKNEKGPNTE